MWESKLLLFTLWTTAFVDAHVQLAFPPSRIDSDYQYTLDGKCNGTSCDSFCGESPANPPVTTLDPGLLALTIKVNVLHPPHKYRISFSNGDDEGYDSHILEDNILNPNPELESIVFNVTVNIPDVECYPVCTLQLYDYYHFVSCSEIIINGSSNITAKSNDIPDASKDKTPILYQQDQGDVILISAEVALPMKSWFAVGLSSDGKMVGSRAIIGNIEGLSAAVEYDLNGKTPNGLSNVKGQRTIARHFNFIVSEANDKYIHYINVTIDKRQDVFRDICGYSIIWAYGNSTLFGYHGKWRGVLGTVACGQSHKTSTTVVPSIQYVADRVTNSGPGTCIDQPQRWKDTDGDTCETYAKAGCPDGNAFRNFGYSAQEVCCACGGGEKVQSVSTRFSTSGVPLTKVNDPISTLISTASISTLDRNTPTLNQQDHGEVIAISAQVNLPAKTWFAIGLSPDGKMVGSRALIGNVGGASGAAEFDLNGWNLQGVSISDGERTSQNSVFVVAEVNDGFLHLLNATFSKRNSKWGDICEFSIIWAHGNSTQLGYHGDRKGVLGTVACRLPLISSTMDATSKKNETKGVAKPGWKACTDHPADWRDSDGDTCDTYADAGCPDGNPFRNFGYSAQEACCACGGGEKVSSISSVSSSSGSPSTSERKLPTLNQEDQGDVIFITAEVNLPIKAWFALGLSPNGKMVGSRALIGNMGGISGAAEFDLNGLSLQGISFFKGERVAQNSVFFVSEVNGKYIHRLNATLLKRNNKWGDICGFSIIWAHGNSTQLGFHGDKKGVLGKVDCKLPNKSTTTASPTKKLVTKSSAKDFLGACVNHPAEWLDSDGDGCQKYAEAGCPDGSRFKNLGYTAQRACCACGGGKEVKTITTSKFTTSSAPTTKLLTGTGLNVECIDHPSDWHDRDGDNCESYAKAGCPDGHRYSRLGLTAQMVCCACGGGKETRSFASSTSIATVASLTKFVRAADLRTSSKTCIDHPALWHDSDGDNCESYETAGCPDGDRYIRLGHTAQTACCACGGGKKVPSIASSTTSATAPLTTIFVTGTNNLKTSSETCIDHPVLWRDSDGDNCKSYAQAGCPDGDRYARLGYTAQTACCACGGGRKVTSNKQTQSIASSASTASTQSKTKIAQGTGLQASSETCIDHPALWSDSDGDNCEGYARADCPDGDRYARLGYTAQTACCACGGGRKTSKHTQSIAASSSNSATLSTNAPTAVTNVKTSSETCVDHPSLWHDSDGDNCESYARAGCPDGDRYTRLGYTAQTACCACGGGKKDQPFTLRKSSSGAEPSGNFATSLSARTDSETCVDYPQGWKDSDGDTCDEYAEAQCPDGDKFKNLGHTAQEACCACGGGRKVKLIFLPNSRSRRAPPRYRVPDKTLVGSVQDVVRKPTSIEPIFNLTDQGETIQIIAEVTLSEESWFAVALSPNGEMVNSRALIGNVDGQSTTIEYQLDGKFPEQVTVVEGAGSVQNSSFEITNAAGAYVHRLTVAFQKSSSDLGDICGMTILWAHSDPEFLSTRLGFHGKGRGAFGTVKCDSR